MAVIIEDITDQEPPAQEMESRETEQAAAAIEEAQIAHVIEEDPLKAEEEVCDVGGRRIRKVPRYQPHDVGTHL